MSYTPHQRRVFYVSAPCGAGKTFSLCNHIKEDRERNILYVAPGIDLIKEIAARLEGIGVRSYDVITSDTHANRVKGAIIKYLENADTEGHLLLITHTAYFALSFFPKRRNWQIFIDEVPQAVNPLWLQIPRHKDLLLPDLEVIPWKTGDLHILKARSPGRLRKILEGPRDQIDEQFRPLFEDLVNVNRITFIDAASWEKLNSDEIYERKQEMRNRVYWLSLLTPRSLCGATILGANIERSLLRKWLERTYKVAFQEHSELVSGLLPVGPVGPRLRLRYFIPERNFSKYLAQMTDKDGRYLIDKMDDLARAELGDKPFLLFCNNDRKKESLKRLGPNAQLVSTYCYGLNSFRGFDRAYFSAAINFAPQHIAMLGHLGLCPEDVHNSLAYETAYQATMRTALRDPNSEAVVTAIVADQRAAEAVASITGCTDVEQIGNVLEPKLPALTGSQKRQRQEYRRILALLTGPNSIPTSFTKENGIIPGPSTVEEFLSSSYQNGGGPSPVFVTLQKNIKEYRHDMFHYHELSVSDIIALFRKISRTPIAQKEDRWLFMPARFEPPKSTKGYRQKEFITGMSCLALDFDGGALCPEKFIELFGENGSVLKLSFILMNSYSRSPAEPNRFRVVIFYQRPITGTAADIERIHKNAIQFIELLLEDAGFPPCSSGLDTQSKQPNQPYHLPCVNRQYPDSHLFESANTKSHELERYALDPMLFDLPEPEEIVSSAVPISISDASKRAITDKLLANLKAMHNGRRRPILNAAIVLVRQVGLHPHEVERLLIDTVGHEKHLRRHVTEAVKWVRSKKMLSLV